MKKITTEILNPEAILSPLAGVMLVPMSWSRLDCYEWCPRQYKFKYWEKRQEGWSMPLAIGNAVHTTLENAIKFRADNDNQIIGWYLGALDDLDPGHLLSNEEIINGKDMAVSAWRLMVNVVPDYKQVIDVEWGFKYVLGAGLFTGYIDLVFWDEDDQGRFIHIVDYKGLAVDTPIPTPTGWTTMGDLKVGDQVLGTNGLPTNVTVKSGTHNRPCYKLTFKDKSSIVCDNVHMWDVAVGQRKQQTMNADELYQLWQDKRPLKWPFSIKNPEPLDLPEADLAIDPYILGSWLGDGFSKTGSIISGSEDYPDVKKNILARWAHEYRETSEPSGCRVITLGNGKGSITLRGLLNKETLLNNKHIPVSYLRGSFDQRLDLLRGLMDTNGSWNPLRKRAVFVNTNEKLIRQVAELVASFGITPQLNEINNNGYRYFRVEFSAYGINPFLIPRKHNAVVMNTRASANKRYIENIEIVESVPTQCIAVDADDALYLAGPLMTPTHNTGNNYDKNNRKKKHTKKHGQTKLYTLAMKRAFPGSRVKASLYWTKHKEIDTYEYSDEELTDFYVATRNKVADIIEDEKMDVTRADVKCWYCTFAKDRSCTWGIKAAERWTRMCKAREAKAKKAS